MSPPDTGAIGARRPLASPRAPSAIGMPRPAALAPHIVTAPVAMLAIGAAMPGSADAVRDALGPLVLMLVFGCLAVTGTDAPDRREGRSALLTLAAGAVICPGSVAILAMALRLPADLMLAAVLAAAAPTAVSAGAICRRFGLPERPPVWAALGGIASAPVLLPGVAALTVMACEADADGRALASAWSLAGRAAIFGLLPASAALLFRRAAPRAVARLDGDLRGVVVLALMGLAFSAGGTLSSRLAGLGDAEATAVLALGLVVVAVSAGAAWGTGRLVGNGEGTGTLARPLLIGAVARNVSFVWAAASVALSPRGEALLALAVAAVFLLPVALLAWTRLGEASRQAPSMSPSKAWKSLASRKLR